MRRTGSTTANRGDLENRRVKFLTFNTWGLKWVSKHRKQRLRAIADELSGSTVGTSLEGSDILQPGGTVFRDIAGEIRRETDSYDIVALQEIWCEEDWDYLVERCSHIFPYHRLFYSGILTGPGLAILSKIPIESTFLYRFPINGRPSAVTRGDWYVGKSIAVTLLDPVTESSAPLAIMNSHMHAPYALTGDAAYHCHRACQSWDFSKLANLYKKAGYAVVIVGDLNSRPGSLQHKFLTMETGLVDSWEQLHGKQDIAAISTLNPMEQLKFGCTTCDSTLNTWRPKCKPTDACRLDYALVDETRLKTVDAGVRFTEKIPEIGSFSDHFAYCCTLELLPEDKQNNRKLLLSKELLLQRYDNYNEMIDTIDKYMTTAETQKLLRGIHFIISMLLLLGTLVVTSMTVNPTNWSSLFWVIFVTVIAVTGTIDGIISFLFGRKEIRALTEVQQEVLDAKHAMELRLNKKYKAES